MQRFKGHVPFLDGVRGMAVLLVYLFHCAPNPYRKGLLEIGWSGVDLFFVLSGLLITGILLDSKDRPRYFSNFFVRRFLRLFPLYYGVLVSVIYIIPAMGGTIGHLASLRTDQLFYWTYTQNIFIALTGVPEFLGFNHFWSLGVEEQFYLFWPLFVRYLDRKRLLMVIGLGIAVSMVLKNMNPNVPFAYMFTFCRTEGLLLGGLAAILIRDPKETFSKWAWPLLALTALGIMLVGYSTGSFSYKGQLFARIGYTLVDVMYFLLIVILHGKGGLSARLRRIFSIRILTLAGKYSYGIYVYHFLFFRLLFHEDIPDMLTFAQLTLLVISVSVISYHLFEYPFLKLKRFFYN